MCTGCFREVRNGSRVMARARLQHQDGKSFRDDPVGNFPKPRGPYLTIGMPRPSLQDDDCVQVYACTCRAGTPGAQHPDLQNT